jgi:hypothetical protein
LFTYLDFGGSSKEEEREKESLFAKHDGVFEYGLMWSFNQSLDDDGETGRFVKLWALIFLASSRFFSLLIWDGKFKKVVAWSFHPFFSHGSSFSSPIDLQLVLPMSLEAVG